MARTFLIIDGYNLMHAAGMARVQYGPGDLERCRSRVLGFLAQHLSDSARERATVVFDAADAPPGLARSAIVDGMLILFAPRGSDADSTIEALIREHSAPRQIRVVSSDHRLHKAARRRRARCLDSEVFVKQLEDRAAGLGQRAGGPLPIPPEKLAGSVSPAEVDEWLEIFGEIPEAENLKRKTDRLQDEVDRLRKELDD